MKRLWLGVAFLILLLASGIWQMAGLSHIHSRLSQTLSDAALAAQQENWNTADTLSQNAQSQWEQYRHITASFADHEPLEEAEQLFAELQLCKALSLEENYAVVCSNLSHICKAIAESFQISWWNVL